MALDGQPGATADSAEGKALGQWNLNRRSPVGDLLVNGGWRLVLGCLENRERIDAAVTAASRWSLADVGKVERAVLRLGTCELLQSDGTPVAVILDESLELARAYAGDDAVQYVNGVLGHIARERV